MIPDIKELNFPKIDGKQYATLTHAEVRHIDMGEKIITTQVRIDGDIAPDFSYDWAVGFKREKYIMPLRIPAGSKGNESRRSEIELTFQHWAVYQLKRWPFVTIQTIEAGTYLADEEVATVRLNLGDFCALAGQVLEYYYGNAIRIDLNPEWEYKQEATLIEISHTKVWDVLTGVLHDKYGVRWEIEASEDAWQGQNNGEKYIIRVGYPTQEADHIFSYGFEGGLLRVERQVQSEEIRNMLKGRGGDKNIPLRYFKKTDPNNKDFREDPDWVEELANIYFTNLMGATFRSYVQGWKAAHISKYPGYSPVGEGFAYSAWAYWKGATDTKFQPVEFVADEITTSPATVDREVEILPGYSPYVKKGSSLDKYGPLPDTLDDNDDIYPTIQGTGMDIAVAVEQIESDDVVEKVESDAQITDYPEGASSIDRNFYGGDAKSFQVTVEGSRISVPEGTYGDINILNPGVKGLRTRSFMSGGLPRKLPDSDYEMEGYTVEVVAQSGEALLPTGIPAGEYTFRTVFDVRYKGESTSPFNRYSFTASYGGAKLVTSETGGDQWKNTFDIWVKNIWASTKLSTENDIEYAERVWKPILGDREGKEAAVVFTSGNLAHEDYEFKIPKGSWPVYDTSKTWEEKDSDGNVVDTHTSHWRIRLAKSDAELEATGLYVPSTKKQGKAGDTFVFIGTEMTQHYVVWNEVALDDWKKEQLRVKKEIKPTFVVTTDRVRLGGEGKSDALIGQLRAGNTIRVADKRLIQPIGDRAYETLYLQSITYTYREPTSDDAALNPDVEIVLGEEYETGANAVAMMQGEISALQRQVGSISNIEQIVRAVGDRLYLRKDGISDISLSPTRFFSLLTSGNFRAGLVGGAGWGFYRDENGNWVLETDRLNVRQDMSVNTLVINQAEGRGGMEVDTAAFMEVTKVVDTPQGYVCYFDQKDGTVANLFHVDDVAFCEQWTPENADLKFYKRRVTAVGADNITLSKTDVNGTGIPAEGDNIIHFGNYTDKTRQYVKVRDVVGGGYERFLDGLDSVTATGTEYYFAGRQTGMYNDRPRWYIGDSAGYIEWVNGELNIKGRINMLSTVGDKPLGEYVEEKAKGEVDKATGVMVSDLDVMYISHTSATDAPALPEVDGDGMITDAKGWQTDAPEWTAGRYIWQTTYVVRGDGTATFSDPACIQGAKGEDAVTVEIGTDFGNVIFNGEGSRTLTARVWRGNRELTGSLPQNRYSWERTSADAADDAVWNRLHEGIGNVCVVTQDDIDRNALFTCVVVIDDL